jgi:hypothetical protein
VTSFLAGWQVVKELLDAVADVIADAADGFDAKARGVVEFPVFVELTREDWGRRRRSPW